MSEMDSLPSDIENEATTVINGLLPTKSKERYEAELYKYEEWCGNRGTTHLTNPVLYIVGT